MNWRDEDIDGLFQGADESAKFTFDEAFFADIEEQLPVRRKRLFWPWLSASFLVVSGLSLLFIYWGNEGERTVDSFKERFSSPILSEIRNTEKENVVEGTGKESLKNDHESQTEMHHSPVKVNYELLGDIETDFQTEETTSNIQQTANGEADMANKVVSTQEIIETSGLPLHPLEKVGHEMISVGISALKEMPKVDQNVFFTLGAGMGQSFISSTENGSSFTQSLSATIGYERFIGKNTSIYGSLGFSQHMFDNLYIKERSVVYGFSSNTIDNQYNFRSLSNMDLNIGVNYRLKRHQLGMSLNISKPLFAGLSYSELIDGETGIEGNGITDCSFFNSVFIEPGASYFYSLTPGLQLGASLNINLSDPVLSERIIGGRTNSPLRGQVILKHNIHLKKR